MRSSLILIAFAVLGFSCSTRKTEKTKSEESLKSDFSGFFRNSGNSEEFLKTDLGLKTNFDFNIDQSVKSESGEFTVSPIDNSKIGVYISPTGEKYILDNTQMTSKNNKEDSNTKTKNSGNSEETINQDQRKKEVEENSGKIQGSTEVQKADLSKNTQRQYSYWNIFWLLIPLALWRLWKKYKSKIPFV